MQKFEFQVVDSAGQSLRGHLFASDQATASQQLRTKGYAILSLTAVESTQSDLQATHDDLTFLFQGTTPTDQTLKGSIEALDLYAAYRKLRLDYNLKLQWLYPSTLAISDRPAAQAQGLDPKFEAKLQSELDDQSPTDRPQNVDEIQTLIAQREEKMVVLRREIESIITEVGQLLNKNLDYLDRKRARDIQQKLDLLSRLRSSNAVNHLQKLSQQLLLQLKDEKLFLESAKLTTEQQAELRTRQSEFVVTQTQLNAKLNDGLQELQQVIAKIEINPEDLKKALRTTAATLDPTEVLLDTTHKTLITLSVIWALIWLSGFIRWPFYGHQWFTHWASSLSLLTITVICLTAWGGYWLHLRLRSLPRLRHWGGLGLWALASTYLIAQVIYVMV